MDQTKIYNITKKQVSNKIYNKIGLSKSYVNKITDDLINILKHIICNKNTNFKNFGSFRILYKKERIGRNPKTKILFKINSRKSLSFLASKKLQNKINRL